MAYSAFSVSFGEQPSQAKWNILGTNDASFNDGTGIAGLYKNLLTADSNPYKFSVHKSAAQTGIVDNTLTKVTFDTEKFDTNNNFASSTYTAPVAGFYQVNVYATLLSPANNAFQGVVHLYKNGASIQATNSYPTSGGTSVYLNGNISHLVQLAANDTLEVYVLMDVTTSTVTVDGGTASTYFSGFLVSRT